MKSVRILAERFVDGAIALADCGGAVHVQRRAFGISDRDERHTVTNKLSIDEREAAPRMIHDYITCYHFLCGEGCEDRGGWLHRVLSSASLIEAAGVRAGR